MFVEFAHLISSKGSTIEEIPHYFMATNHYISYLKSKSESNHCSGLCLIDLTDCDRDKIKS